MALGPILIFDKSVIQSLTVDEAALLDNFYMSNIPPVFFAECLADLEREMIRAKGSPESLVVSLSAKTPESQARGNVFHMQLLEGELAGHFDLKTVNHRPVVGQGQTVATGDAKGLLFRPSDEEEAVQRWARGDFWGLERQLAKRWRRMIERIDLEAMSKTLLTELGPWRKPTSLQQAKEVTDAMLRHLDQEWLLRFGLEILGLDHAIERTVERWRSDRRKDLHLYFPYFTHILSINIFFALALPAELLSNVKPSHHIDLAYLYYLPFCSIFTSSDKFHISVAPFFMDSSQTFLPGHDLKNDLARLDAKYQELSQEELDKGLIHFANQPPEDISFFTTQMWDKYLPSWRAKKEPSAPLSPELISALTGMVEELSDAMPAHHQHDVDKLEFVTLSKKVSVEKGRYLLFSKEQTEKALRQEREKDEKRDSQTQVIRPAGSLFSSLVAELLRLQNDPKVSNVEICLVAGKYDDNGEKIIADGMWAAQIHRVGVDVRQERGVAALKDMYESLRVLRVLVLWMRYGEGRVGMMKFLPLSETEAEQEDETWVGQCVRAYMDTHEI